jgi:N-acetylglutamate synthase-like GNAT family acetyltransferase
MPAATAIRRCTDSERDTVLEIINTAAKAYCHVIPADCWKEPYMPVTELDHEISAGVKFWGYEQEGRLAGVMGMQSVRDVDLIRHAYVRTEHQRCGIGAALLRHLCHLSTQRLLVGTWAAATWAIQFYRRHGFTQLDPPTAAPLLKSYWSIPQRQLEAATVLVFDSVLA